MQTVQLIQVSPDELSELINEKIRETFLEIVPEISRIQNNFKEFLSKEETAEFFNVSVVCIYQWSKKGLIKPYKMGNRVYFKRTELIDALINSNP